jgi:hypothetical protein
MLMVGANDGELHVSTPASSAAHLPKLDDGTVTPVRPFDPAPARLFAFIPRAALPTINYYAQPGTNRWAWSVDGTVRTDDVYIDARPQRRELSGCRSASGDRLRSAACARASRLCTRPNGPDVHEQTGPPTDRRVGETLDVRAFLPGSGSCSVAPPFPTVLWEFTDDALDSGAVGVNAHGAPMDEDNEGGADLGFTWSVPTTGRIRVCTSNCGVAGSEVTEDRFVAIFGGGLVDNTNKSAGDWLYMVDIETGKVIYKRPVLGAVPNTVAAVDTDQDSYLDTAYFGTTAGYLYKVISGGLQRPALWQYPDPELRQRRTTRSGDSHYRQSPSRSRSSTPAAGRSTSSRRSSLLPCS